MHVSECFQQTIQVDREMALKIVEVQQLSGDVMEVESRECQSTDCQQLNLRDGEAKMLRGVRSYSVQDGLCDVEQRWNVLCIEL